MGLFLFRGFFFFKMTDRGDGDSFEKAKNCVSLDEEEDDDTDTHVKKMIAESLLSLENDIEERSSDGKYTAGPRRFVLWFCTKYC